MKLINNKNKIVLVLALVMIIAFASFVYSGNKAGGIPVLQIECDISINELNASKENVGKGIARFYDENGDTVYDGELSSIKGRGSSSWKNTVDEKPYNIKLKEKAELIPGAGKAKKWCLLNGDTYDSFAKGKWIKRNPLLSSLVGFKLYKDLGGNYAIEVSPVDLYINGDYRGCYLLAEAVQINSERVDIKESVYEVEGETQTKGTVSVMSNGTEVQLEARYSSDAKLKDGVGGGMLLEMDSVSSDKDDCYFITTHGVRYLFKDPDMPTKEQVAEIAQYIQDYEDALFALNGYNSQNKYYADYFDIKSNAIEVATELLTTDGDIYYKSCFFAIDVDDSGQYGKIVSGPSWDFDACAYGYDYKVQLDEERVEKLAVLRELLRKEDFLCEVEKILYGRGRTLMESYAGNGGYIEQCAEKYSKAKAATHKRWKDSIDFNGGADDPYSAEAFLSGFKTHLTYFYQDFWTDELKDYLFGIADSIKKYHTFSYVTYSDVPSGAYYTYAVNWASNNGITYGTGGGKFTPAMKCTRYQTECFIYRTLGSPKADKYAEDANEPISRADYMYLLWKAVGSPKTAAYSFDDVQADAYYADAVSWAAKKGISYGTGNNMFSPDATITRAEALTFLYRYFVED